jgi:N-methylhydantoinase A
MRVAFDIGGTFTDVILADDSGRLVTKKVLSEHERLGDEIAQIIDSEGSADGVSSFVHATTVCSNALIEKTLPRVVFVTTKGFAHVLEFMSHRGPAEQDLNWERIAPLVPNELCFEVEERTLADGSIAVPLSSDVDALAEAIRHADVKAVAVCLLNSFVNGDHERRLAAELQRKLPGLPICISSDVDPEMKEYERASTTVINTVLIPLVSEYLDHLQSRLNSYSTTLRIMQSNGGTMSSTVARKRPMTMIESGPAAGALAAAEISSRLGIEHVLSFDMGGTTAKACFIENGRPLEKPQMEIGASVGAAQLRGQGHTLRTPSLDIVEVGAGGGSIAWIDDSGALRVGPASAGASPGPACYRKGGSQPTVTDANVVLGYINANAIADGNLLIDRDAAVLAVSTHIAEPLGLDLMEAAHGIVAIANSTMMRALRAVSTERGRDIRAATLLAFGGSGPLHAASLCDSVDINRIIVPPMPGVLSAFGLLLAGERLDYVRSIERPLRSVDDSVVQTAYDELLEAAKTDLRLAGSSIDNARVDVSVDLRYSFEPGELTFSYDIHAAPLDHDALIAHFMAARAKEYGFAGDGEVHFARMRMRVTTGSDRAILAARSRRERSENSTESSRPAYFRSLGTIPTRVLTRAAISGTVEGPLIIEEPTTTVVVPPAWAVTRDDMDNLLIERQG